ncbi:MAG: hypothetical protein Q4C70_01300 [Planctomycetia bacterium]|nr:hypothetical protein [Planctomycetia bacterium]
MKKYEYNRQFTLRAALKILIPWHELRLVFGMIFIGFPLLCSPTDILFPWTEKEEVGMVTRSFPTEEWFGTYYTHEFHFLDSNGREQTKCSFSKNLIPVGSTAKLEQSIFKDVRIQGTSGGIWRDYPTTLMTWKFALVAIGVVSCTLLPLYLITRIYIFWMLSHGIPVQARLYDSSQKPPLYVCGSKIIPLHEISIDQNIYDNKGRRIGRKREKITHSLAFVHPTDPEFAYLWAWFDSLKINQTQDKIDIIPEKTLTYRMFKVFRNVFKLRFRDIFHEIPKYIRQNTPTLLEEIGCFHARLELKIWRTVFIIITLLCAGPYLLVLGTECLPFWETVPQTASLISSERDMSYENQVVYENKFQWRDSAGMLQESVSYSERKMTEKSLTIEKWGEKYRICGTWNSMPDQFFLKLPLFFPIYFFYLTVVVILNLTFRFLEEYPSSVPV